jgi:hypothetical protein
MLSILSSSVQDYLSNGIRKLKSMLYISQMNVKWYEPHIEKAKDYDFNETVDKSDKEFWQGVSSKIVDEGGIEVDCILHVKTNLIISYEGELIGRDTDEGVIYLNELDPKIIQWYKNCDF